jgi:hypothetical protein
MTEEHRLFTRIPFEATVHVTSAEGSWDCELIDVSLKGILVGRPDSWSGIIDDPF